MKYDYPRTKVSIVKVQDEKIYEAVRSAIDLVGGIGKYVKKGDLVYIEGKLRTRTWNDKSGIQRYITEIYIDTFMLLNSKKGQ